MHHCQIKSTAPLILFLSLFVWQSGLPQIPETAAHEEATSTTPAVPPNIEATLREWQAMVDRGEISREDYEIKRKALLLSLPPPCAPTSPSSPSRGAAERLKELKTLLDQNLITSEEYESKRQAILKEL